MGAVEVRRGRLELVSIWYSHMKVSKNKDIIIGISPHRVTRNSKLISTYKALRRVPGIKWSCYLSGNFEFF